MQIYLVSSTTETSFKTLNLFLKIVAQNVGCVSAYFCGGKIAYGYDFVAPLMSLIYYFDFVKIILEVIPDIFLSVLIQ